MAEGRFERELLERLSKGEDCVWIFIPERVLYGKISRNEALISLKTGLEIAISKYEEAQRNMTYESSVGKIHEELSERLEEAERVLESINNGCNDIVYMGFKLY
ncbi:hypothetical protein HYX15_03720 [Candidatus Woesearchaeota archaeon]|nr:hypothetical protein [Candidatus Woesearchaeota archaeon]